MNHYSIEMEVMGPKHMTRDYFEELFDSIADVVADLGDGVDGDVSASFSEHLITMHFSLDDDTDEGAFTRGMSAARTVFHAIGWNTPGWDELRLQRAPAQTPVAH